MTAHFLTSWTFISLAMKLRTRRWCEELWRLAFNMSRKWAELFLLPLVELLRICRWNESAFQATFLMTIGFVFLLIFVVIVIWRQSSLRMTPFLGRRAILQFCSGFFCNAADLVTVTLITPFLATVAAFGLLSWLKYPIYSMQCVTPFLVLGIGEAILINTGKIGRIRYWDGSLTTILRFSRQILLHSVKKINSARSSENWSHWRSM